MLLTRRKKTRRLAVLTIFKQGLEVDEEFLDNLGGTTEEEAAFGIKPVLIATTICFFQSVCWSASFGWSIRRFRKNSRCCKS